MSERDGFQPGVPSWAAVIGPATGQPRHVARAVFGWGFTGPGEMAGVPPGEYFVAQLRGRDVAGVASLPADAPAPTWNTYSEVADVDESAAMVEEAGGKVLV